MLVLGSIVLSACASSSSKKHESGAAKAPTAAAHEATTTATTCTGKTATTPGQSTATLSFGGLDRSYLLHVPAGYDPTRRAPLLFNFHGHGSSAAAELAYADFRPLAERDNFLVVAPDGQGTSRHFTLLGATATEADDVDFALAVLDRLESELCVDPRRVFATGMSNGGALSSVLACRAADRFAAVAAVAAMIFVPPCTDHLRPAPIVGMAGDADPVVPFAGGRVNCCGNPNIPAVADTMRDFAARAGCEATPAEERPAPTIVHRVWKGCGPGAAVELYVIEGGGHTWPGSPFDLASRGLGETTKDLIATDTIWAFFTNHPRPAT